MVRTGAELSADPSSIAGTAVVCSVAGLPPLYDVEIEVVRAVPESCSGRPGRRPMGPAGVHRMDS